PRRSRRGRGPLTSTRVEGVSPWRGPASSTRSSWLPKIRTTSSALSAGPLPARVALLDAPGPPLRLAVGVPTGARGARRAAAPRAGAPPPTHAGRHDRGGSEDEAERPRRVGPDQSGGDLAGLGGAPEGLGRLGDQRDDGERGVTALEARDHLHRPDVEQRAVE